MSRLETLRSVWPIYLTAHFWILFLLTLGLTFGVNYGVDYGMHKMNETYAVINGSSFATGVLVVVLIIDVLVFFGGGDIRKRIIEGKAHPVAQSALCDTLFKRVFLFSLAVPNWKDRFPRFVAQTLFFPGVFVVIVVYGACYFASGAPSSLPQNGCVVPLHEYLAYTEGWKTFIAACVFIINYAAFHNDAQPELQETSINGNVANDTNPLLSPEDVRYGVPIATYQQQQYSAKAV